MLSRRRDIPTDLPYIRNLIYCIMSDNMSKISIEEIFVIKYWLTKLIIFMEFILK